MKPKTQKRLRAVIRWIDKHFLKLNRTPPLIPGPIEKDNIVSTIEIRFKNDCPVWKEKLRIQMENERGRE